MVHYINPNNSIQYAVDYATRGNDDIDIDRTPCCVECVEFCPGVYYAELVPAKESLHAPSTRIGHLRVPSC